MYFVSAYSELPAFLTPDGGLNSGFMIAHCTAAALGERVNFYLVELSRRRKQTTLFRSYDIR